MKTKSVNTRTRSGCLTCRDRHMKCDEALPICNKCKKLNRKCVRGIRLNFIQYLTYDPWVNNPRSRKPSNTFTPRIIDQLITVASLYQNGLLKYKRYMKYHTQEELNEAYSNFHQLLKKLESKTNQSYSENNYSNITKQNRQLQNPTIIDPLNPNLQPQYQYGLYPQNPLIEDQIQQSMYNIQYNHPIHLIAPFNKPITDTVANSVNVAPEQMPNQNIQLTQTQKEIQNPPDIGNSFVNQPNLPQYLIGNLQNWGYDNNNDILSTKNIPIIHGVTNISGQQVPMNIQSNYENYSSNDKNTNTNANTNTNIGIPNSSQYYLQSNIQIGNQLSQASISHSDNILISNFRAQKLCWFPDLFNCNQIWHTLIPYYLLQNTMEAQLIKTSLIRITETTPIYLSNSSNSKANPEKLDPNKKIFLHNPRRLLEVFEGQMKCINEYGRISYVELLFSVSAILLEILIATGCEEMKLSKKISFFEDGMNSFNVQNQSLDVQNVFFQQIQIFNIACNNLILYQHPVAQAILMSLIHIIILLKFVITRKFLIGLLPLNELEVDFLNDPNKYSYGFQNNLETSESSINKTEANLGTNITNLSKNDRTNVGLRLSNQLTTNSYLLCQQFCSLIRLTYNINGTNPNLRDHAVSAELLHSASGLITPQNFDPYKEITDDKIIVLSILVQQEEKKLKPHLNNTLSSFIREMLYKGQLRYLNDIEMKSFWQIFFNWDNN